MLNDCLFCTIAKTLFWYLLFSKSSSQFKVSRENVKIYSRGDAKITYEFLSSCWKCAGLPNIFRGFPTYVTWQWKDTYNLTNICWVCTQYACRPTTQIVPADLFIPDSKARTPFNTFLLSLVFIFQSSSSYKYWIKLTSKYQVIFSF